MAKKTKGKAKKTELTAVAGGGEAKKKIETPREFVEAALKFSNDAISSFEVAMAHLNDPKGHEFFKALPNELRPSVVSGIGSFAQKTSFALTSLRDEIQIALGGERRAQKEAAAAEAPAPKPLFDVPTPQVDVSTAVAAEPGKVVTIADLEEIHRCYDLTIAMLAEAQFAGMQYENVAKVITFQVKVRDSVRAALVQAKKAAA